MKAEKTRKKVFWFLFILVLLAGGALKLYKAHHAGIIYDESYTFAHFGQNIDDALNSYVNPNNNHVLNSILICAAYKFFGSYEHFIRIPSALAGIIFSLALGVIVFKTIANRPLKVAVLALVTLNHFSFDLSFLARGYAFALAGIFAGVAIVIWLLDSKIKYRNLWAPIVTISLMNFIAFGTMLSSVWVLAAVNIVFILFFSHRVFVKKPKGWSIIAINLLGILSLSGVLLYGLYKNLYEKILAGTGKFGLGLFGPYIKRLLIDSILDVETELGVLVSGGFILLGIASLAICLYRIKQRIRVDSLKQLFDRNQKECFIFLVTAVTVLAVFFHRVVLGKSIGYPRNSVFLIPLVLISIGIIFDKAIAIVKLRYSGRFFGGLIVFVVAGVVLQNLPTTSSVRIHNWDRQCISGPLLHKLKTIDPDKNWRIILSKDAYYINWGLIYYKRFGYNFDFARDSNWDIAIIYKTEKTTGAVYLDEDCFKKFNCFVVINPKLLQDKVIPYERLSRGQI